LGARRTGPAVADAGPLIHLAETSCLRLLATFDGLHIPDAVWEEANRHSPMELGAAMAEVTVHRHTVSETELSRFVGENNLGNLHRGEGEGLFLCRKLGVPVLLTDDMAVREATKRLGMTPVGSLGVVVKAWDLGCISLVEAEHYIVSLQEVSSLFVTGTIVDLVLERLREYRKHR
jgi:predicted nucleic acid-binding protein